MRPRAMLAAALVTGGLAVLTVGLDVVWGTTATLEGFTEEGNWVVVATTDPEAWRYERFGTCVTDYRLVISNDRPFAKSLDVLVMSDEEGHTQTTLYDHAVEVPAFGEVTIDLDTPAPWTVDNQTVYPHVWANVDDMHLGSSPCHYYMKPGAPA